MENANAILSTLMPDLRGEFFAKATLKPLIGGTCPFTDVLLKNGSGVTRRSADFSKGVAQIFVDDPPLLRAREEKLDEIGPQVIFPHSGLISIIQPLPLDARGRRRKTRRTERQDERVLPKIVETLLVDRKGFLPTRLFESSSRDPSEVDGNEGLPGLVPLPIVRVAGIGIMISANELEKICQNSALLRRRIETATLSLTRSSMCYTARRTSMTVEELVIDWFIRAFAAGDNAPISISQVELSEALQVQRTTVSSVMNRLKLAGAISHSPGEVRLMDETKLRAAFRGSQPDRRTLSK